MVLKCRYCNKEFIPSRQVELDIMKNPDKPRFCSRACLSKFNGNLKKAKEIKFKCCTCNREFILSQDQRLKYNRGITDFYCSRSCAGKAIMSNKDIVSKRNNKLAETKLNRYGEAAYNNRDKAKQTNLIKYGEDCIFKTKKFKIKAKQTKLQKYNNENYNNRDKMFETMLKHNFDIHSPRPEVGKKVSEAWKNKSEEEKTAIKIKLSKANTKAHNEMTLSKKLEISAVLSEAQKHRWQDTSSEQKEAIFKKVFSHPNTIRKVISKTNKDVSKCLNITEFEFNLDGYSYDLKKDNVLIEIDPTYTHNCAIKTWYGSKPKTKEYHRDKTMVAADNGYTCIHIFDWDNLDKIKYMLSDKQNIYARKLAVKQVDIESCDEFLNKYHIQNTCKNQTVRLGLYRDNELVQIMTFGKPRYNKNYEWELLRLCSHKDYKVVGGANKLFAYFLVNLKPNSVISYCDFSKFSGDVYTRLGFKQIGSIIPSKHWSKGHQHITDNLLRQRGYDQLFRTNYGKGTSNEQLMIDNGWLPVYDAGQITFVWDSASKN